jgi:hypothetical protein
VLNQLTDIKDLKGVDVETVIKIYDKVKVKRYSLTSQVTTKTITNLYSDGLTVQRVNQLMYNVYQDDLLNRANIYGNALDALDMLCINGVLKGKTFP